MSITFDQTLSIVRDVLTAQRDNLEKLGSVVINRDLNGRIRLVLNEQTETDESNEIKAAITAIAHSLTERLGPYGFPYDRMVLFEPSLDMVTQGAPHFSLDGLDNVIVVDRLATETDWSNIAPVSSGAPRIVFFSIKGGVGRSTAMAVAAWSLAQSGKRVMVLDLDLESPGLSSSLLPHERRPGYGITDWLVEDIVNNGDTVLDDMVARSDLSHDGEIYVVPAHGRDAGEYIAKLGRVWIPKVDSKGFQESWPRRLNRLLQNLEKNWGPDVILIDSRAGIDEVASACITDLGATGVLLFAMDGDQTWSGYSILFRHWHRTGVVRDIRERLKLVAAMVPEVNGAEYIEGLRERSWETFAEQLYDDVPPGEPTSDYISFDLGDETAPHYPWPIRWNRGFAALQSIHGRLRHIDRIELSSIFGPMVECVHTLANVEGEQRG